MDTWSGFVETVKQASKGLGYNVDQAIDIVARFLFRNSLPETPEQFADQLVSRVKELFEAPAGVVGDIIQNAKTTIQTQGTEALLTWVTNTLITKLIGVLATMLGGLATGGLRQPSRSGNGSWMGYYGWSSMVQQSFAS